MTEIQEVARKYVERFEFPVSGHIKGDVLAELGVGTRYFNLVGRASTVAWRNEYAPTTELKQAICELAQTEPGIFSQRGLADVEHYSASAS